ncbi:STAS domain-containing protein [Pseudoalteromonas tunicata]|jgi:ABC-type transporter Mla MlaB component|uniref:STAS domain-containing protein n=1 Tax=Pseudoalteromonas tunicata D2 TaxID=87626 RepID=A4CEW2_9GAMM|nr:STAS domain-containing protein [Pseudoalteromonas tunicata]ATC96103.1 hypothetical protein PTUN_a3837 [Pseudoalteromonas tunicata]AXT31624.1 STAS domain-containing protein [Pseudoalteromonas tunicata]EAR26841.1 hypothetical protein PTD2_16891 [Pseudoalteromonas tunicata D2]MDP4982679.1 STAS domain-containing protein [Pseudoalteromonas tunicata]
MHQLPEELVINNINTFYQSIIEMLNDGRDIIFDISKVSQADTASIQLLCVLQKHLLSTDHQIQWHGNSKALLSSAKTLGVSEFLSLEQI